ncbi:hypothetical protein [Paraflavitalea speifideaquila]|uniref:hypothetical protein n=1 Tax=Paraflavitalea speifideaquila TaxID=3076558 RepID=UPI0028E5031A|nr:hypothetical protein [Paraflavitalea speifideiaquila]
METLNIKETLKSKLNAGVEPAVDLLYSHYSSMLYGYVLQFIPDEKEAEKVLVLVFGTLAARLQEACTSTLSVYCWMQVEARKIILDYRKQKAKGANGQPHPAPANKNTYYLSLLQNASDEQKLVFSEIYLHGRDKEDLAIQLQKRYRKSAVS